MQDQERLPEALLDVSGPHSHHLCEGQVLLESHFSWQSSSHPLHSESTGTEQAGSVLEGYSPVEKLCGPSTPGLVATCPPTHSSVSGPPVKSEEAGAPQAVSLAQVGRQRAAHLPGGGADALGSLHGPAQGLVELLQVTQVKLDGMPVPPGWRGRGCGGPLSSWLG